jgi:hypothetical protein
VWFKQLPKDFFISSVDEFYKKLENVINTLWEPPVHMLKHTGISANQTQLQI